MEVTVYYQSKTPSLPLWQKVNGNDLTMNNLKFFFNKLPLIFREHNAQDNVAVSSTSRSWLGLEAFGFPIQSIRDSKRIYIACVRFAELRIKNDWSPLKLFEISPNKIVQLKCWFPLKNWKDRRRFHAERSSDWKRKNFESTNLWCDITLKGSKNEAWTFKEGVHFFSYQKTLVSLA